MPVYEKLFTKYELALREIGIELCSLETNLVRAIIPRRLDKVKAIVAWDFVQQNLRVCTNSAFQDPSREWLNCSRCEKCLRTMIPIYALDRMARFGTFSKPLRSNYEGLLWARKFSPYPGFVTEINPFVRQHKVGMVPWLRVAAVLGMIRYQFLKLIPRKVKLWTQRFGYFIDPFDQKDTFENLEVIQLIESSH